ncbi:MULTISPECIES: maleylpyruvate isomerase family mycothiol-dependent enzyme [unclassified Micromonospora]|uniref:maleylpyruvate isomerase family mycothiol-dependent enzyme n=1 Tax=unclassified Micromonospora TaxID=2617518 RepID=UPI002FF085C9
MTRAAGSAVQALRTERLAFLATVASLEEEVFDSGPTLCAGWAPRDVLAHVVGIDDHLDHYLRAGGNVNRANARIVAAQRTRSRTELLHRAREWAERPRWTARLAAGFLLGDLAVHHHDVLFPLGRSREIPEVVRRAMLREGTILGIHRLRHHRVVPTDLDVARGRGPVLTGSTEAIAMWLAGRDVYRRHLHPTEL